MVVNIAQGMPGIVADILAEARRPMTIKEIATEVDRLGRTHARYTSYKAAIGALQKRKKKVGDVRVVSPGVWETAKP
jgi:hypothetical protein